MNEVDVCRSECRSSGREKGLAFPCRPSKVLSQSPRRDFPAKTPELPHINKLAPTRAAATLHVIQANRGRTLSEQLLYG